MNKAIVMIKWSSAALLGLLMVVFIYLSLGVRWHLVTWVLGITIAVFSGTYAKNHLSILFLALIAIYTASFLNVTRRVNMFCASINASTKPSDLVRLAEDIDVEFSFSELGDNPGNYYGLAPNPFTVGDHACRIYFTKEKILSAKASTH